MTEKSARRVLQSVLVSLNGVTSEPMAWAAPFFGERSAAHSLAGLERCDAMLMGRGTYEVFSKQWPSASGEYADHINNMPKFVFSSTLGHADWDNTTLISGDVVDEVTALKQAGGRDLIVYGHGQFGQTLCDAGLVDELSVTIVPVFVAAGATFYRPGGTMQAWRLVGTGNDLDPDMATLTYRPCAVSTVHHMNQR
jgi:dihydrofolate reductase